MKNSIQTCLWFNTEAEQAAKLYTSLFTDSEIHGVIPYGRSAAQASGQVEGSVLTVDFLLSGVPFLALNGGPHFKANPSISFFVGCESEAEMDGLWHKLKSTVRMELATYPFAKKYGWCEDQFGINWQLFLGKTRQKILPALLFSNKKYGRAKEAIDFYTSAFPGSEVESIAVDERTKAVLHARISLLGSEFVVMEGPLEPQFDFSPAVSFVLGCKSQEELDSIWSKLTASSEAEQCGWLRDKYGVSWQILPEDWGRMLLNADAQTREHLMKSILGMKKPNIEILKKALHQK